MMKMLTAMICAGSLIAGSAQANCWNRDEAAAAGVRQLQSMLMVTALRCQAAGSGMMNEYNAFVAGNRQAIVLENERIRAHFIHASGTIAGQRAYDAFTTSMANGYGAGQGAPASCGEAGALAHEASTAGTVDALLMLVDQLGLIPALPEGRCDAAPMTVAAATPVPAPAAAVAPAPVMVVAEAAPAPAPAMQPADYVPPPPVGTPYPVRYMAVPAYAPPGYPMGVPAMAYAPPPPPYPYGYGPAGR